MGKNDTSKMTTLIPIITVSPSVVIISIVKIFEYKLVGNALLRGSVGPRDSRVSCN